MKWILYYAWSKKTDKFDTRPKSTKPSPCNDRMFEANQPSISMTQAAHIVKLGFSQIWSFLSVFLEKC